MEHKVKNTYNRASDAELTKLGFRVAQNMNGNATFPNPNPTQAVLDTTCKDFLVAQSIAGTDRTKISAKNDKRAELLELLSQLADYVNETSQGDKTKLLSSGFDVIGEKKALQVMQPIEKITIEAEMPGQAITRVKKVTGAKSYIHQYTPDPVTPDSAWVSETITDRECTFTNLQSVKKYWFRVIAIGHGKQSVYSPPVARVIQ